MKPGTWSEFRNLCSRPERIVWAVAEFDGRRSICPLGWKMNTSGSPPMMAISVAPQRFSHGLIEQSGEVVLAWPGETLAAATLLCGTKSGRDTDKFAAAGLTAMPARRVRAPLVGECLANLECRVTGRLATGDHTIFACEVLEIWVRPEAGRALISVDGSAGYDRLLDGPGYRFGAVRRG